jgi:DNA-binding NarL/FixJ family response regulator
MERMMDPQMRIVIADRHAEVRSALRLLLENIDHDWSVIAEVSDLKGLQSCSNLQDADLVLLEWTLPGLSSAAGKQRLSDIRGRGQPLIVALGSSFDDGLRAQAAGVDAFISKIEPPERVITVLREIGKATL